MNDKDIVREGGPWLPFLLGFTALVAALQGSPRHRPKFASCLCGGHEKRRVLRAGLPRAAALSDSLTAAHDAITIGWPVNSHRPGRVLLGTGRGCAARVTSTPFPARGWVRAGSGPVGAENPVTSCDLQVIAPVG